MYLIGSNMFIFIFIPIKPRSLLQKRSDFYTFPDKEFVYAVNTFIAYLFLKKLIIFLLHISLFYTT